MDKKKKYILIAVFCVIGLALGSTFAWFAWRSDDNTSITIRTGGVKVTYSAGNDITGRKLRPVSTKEYGVENDYAIKKDIEVSATKNLYFSLYLNVETLVEGIDHESLKWELYDGENLMSSGNFKYVEQGDKITLITNYKINTETHNLTLYIWIDGENYDNPSEMQNKDYKFVLNAEATDNEVDHGLQYYDVSDTTPGVLVGNGTETDPYLIESIEDLIAFSNNVNNGNSYEGEYVVLKQSLNFNYDKSYVDSTNTTMFSDYNGDGTTSSIKEEVTTGQGFIPIGINLQVNGSNTINSKYFSGNFSGDGNSIINIYIYYNSDSNYDTTYVGLFGFANSATIKNLSLSGSIQGELVGEDLRIAGIVGLTYMNSNISNLVNYAEIKGMDSTRKILYNYNSDIVVGGICAFVGPNNVTSENVAVIEDNSNYGDLVINGEDNLDNNSDSFRIGGIIGNNANGIMKRNVNHGKIIANIPTEANDIILGGCVSMTFQPVYECVNSKSGTITGNVSGNVVAVGGVSGALQIHNLTSVDGYLTSSYNKADIILVLDSTAEEVRVGGIVGSHSRLNVTNSYSAGNIIIDNELLFGGISGAMRNSATLTNSYYLNTIDALYGYTDDSAITITNSSSKTESEMKSSAFIDLLNAGLDEPVWIMDTEGINDGYPILSFQK